jgi:hypothetical protein
MRRDVAVVFGALAQPNERAAATANAVELLNDPRIPNSAIRIPRSEIQI